MTDKCRTDSTDCHDNPAQRILDVIAEASQAARLRIRTADLFSFFNFGADEARHEMMNSILCSDEELFETTLKILINEAAISPEFTNNIALNKFVTKAVRDYAKDAIENNTDTWSDC